ncbi:unknown [[Mannheimia] succiniciproducens MBEL55E]|uniref:Uncharacterized protein n=1 Tax=Mannheimia succiniciproducens (strain KCTC 0769BP / MBEL55E) TaxID=221988 RepID=Q65TI6_MANSM|nr:unknown [[Mannheimia] succiniciproducens MBEL55E]
MKKSIKMSIWSYSLFSVNSSIKYDYILPFLGQNSQLILCK